MARHWRCRAAVAALALATLTGCGPAAPRASCAPRDLIWVYDRVTDLDDHGYPTRVFTWRAGEETAVTRDDAADAPSVSPDGRRVAYQRGSDGDPESAGYQRYRLYVADRDGKRERPLLDPAYEISETAEGAARDKQPVWSPDGRQVAFLREAGEAATVMVVSPDGGAPRVVSRLRGLFADVPPAWSPDGRRRAWVVGGDAGTVLHWSGIDGDGAASLALREYAGSVAFGADGGALLAAVEDPDTRGRWVQRVELASRDVQRVDLGFSELWRLPTGELAGLEPVGERPQMPSRQRYRLVVTEYGGAVGKSPGPVRSLANLVGVGGISAVPALPGGWRGCRTASATAS